MNHNLFQPTNLTESEPDSNPEKSQDSPETVEFNLPATSPDQACHFYLKEIERLGRMNEIKNFLLDTAGRDFHEFSDPLDLSAFSAAYSEFIAPTITSEDKTALKNYSGFGYKVINQVARGQWNYDLLGRQTPDKLADARQAADQISDAIAHIPSPGVDLVAHRGANMDSFRAYGINSLSNLTNLEGQFFLETGFTSTSLSPDKSFVGKDFDDPLRRTCDVEITCRIPKESGETIGLLSSDLAYNPEQSELLIDRGSLFYISAAELSPDRSRAHLEMTLIPRNLYDPAYSQES